MGTGRFGKTVKTIFLLLLFVLAFPNWWGTLPMPVYTFLESYDFSGKTVLPLCVSGGGGFGKSLNDLKNAIPDAYIGNGLNMRESEMDEAQEKIRDWIEDSGISRTAEAVGLSESEV